MRRTELEKRLRALGYAPVGQVSGKGYMAWYGRGRRLSIPQRDIILDDVAEAILAAATAADPFGD